MEVEEDPVDEPVVDDDPEVLPVLDADDDGVLAEAMSRVVVSEAPSTVAVIIYVPASTATKAALSAPVDSMTAS